MDGPTSVERFYRRLLELDSAPDLSACVADALCLLTEITGARFAIAEVFESESFEDIARWRFRAPSRANDVVICDDVVRAALEDRATLNIASADLHRRFRDSPAASADAILCVPIGAALPVGVIYLQGRSGPGRFPDADRERTELFSTRLAAVADRLMAGAEAGTKLDDNLRWYSQRVARACVEQHAGNISRAANQLGITRSRMYRILASRARR